MLSFKKGCGDAFGACCGYSSRKGMSAKMSEEETISSAAFLPECVRNALREMKGDEQVTIPFFIHFPATFLLCEIPALHESVDLFSISNTYSILDVMDELNLHISGIIKRLVIERGDILQLEDRFIGCVWPVEVDDVQSMYRVTLNTALTVQEEFGSTQTKLGFQLQNKIVISVGEIIMMFVGSEKSYYLPVGEVMKETRNSLAFCGAKEVIVTTDFWKRIKNKDNYRWKQNSKNHIVVYSTTVESPRIDEKLDKDNYKLFQSFADDIDEEIEKFLHPIHKSAKTTEQLQILASLTQVVVMAIRTIDLGSVNSVDTLHNVVNLVNQTVEKQEGITTKIVFRKDPIILIIFGFPGFKHTDDAVRSILCAHDILKSLTDVNIAIAITSGMAFCGVLGSSLRQEYCVFGIPTRIALSLLDQFEGLKIVCDINVFFRSCRIVGEIFTPLRKKLKGVKCSNLFFEVHSSESQKFFTTPKIKCIGRKPEKFEIRNALEELKGSMENLGTLLPLIHITGKLGTGKSTMLGWALRKGKSLGYRLTARVNNNAFEETNSNAWSILTKILMSRSIDSESKILETLGPSGQQFPLHLLNAKMNTSFRQPALSLGDENALEMMVQLMKKCAHEEPILIGVDNAEHTGTESWLFLQCLLVNHTAVVIATVSEEFNSSVPFVKHLMGQQYLSVNLGPIHGRELGALACHILHVSAIHKGFLSFLQVQSEGNALHLQEILMLAPLQKHYCLIPYPPENVLKENFVCVEEEDRKIDRLTAKACDIVDPEGLLSIKIPKHLLDLVKDHTTGLNPEEQMLVRKCSLFGDSFGLRILDTVCPEYSSDELTEKVQSLVEKNILTFVCEHWSVVRSERGRRFKLEDALLEYCLHPLRFVSCFLKKTVIFSMAETQRERLNLYLADLLREDPNKSCDACRKEVEAKRSSTSRHELMKPYKVPNVDFRLCQCLNFKTDILIQVEFHLEKGNAPISKQIDVLLEAAEAGLDAGALSKVEEIAIKIKRLGNLHENNGEPDYVSIAIERIRARIKMQMGKTNDALRCLKHAMLIMQVFFPNDITGGSYKSKKFQGRLAVEERRCLSLGCFILISLSLAEDATPVGKLLVKCLHSNCEARELIESKILLLKAVSKTEQGKSREKAKCKLVNEIRQQCFKRLSENPTLQIEELRTIIRAFKFLVHLLLETAALEAAKDLGCKSFQLLKIVNYPKQLVRILFLLTIIYFYEEDYEKCREMLNQLQDASQQSGDSISEIIYHTALAKVIREPKISDDHKDLIKICEDYAVLGNDSFSYHPKYTNRIFCLSSTMALLCLKQELSESFPVWYNQALELEKSITLNNYLSISGSIYLGMVKILKMQEKCFIFTQDEISSLKQKMNKSIENIRKQVKNFVPVLERDVKEIEKCLQKALKDCKVLRH